MKNYTLIWESDLGLEEFHCTALSEYEAKQKAAAKNPEIIDCLVEVQEVNPL